MSVRENETEAERLDRNFADLLQELRVAQAGVQILFAFLLTLPFAARFGEIDRFEQAVYIGALFSAALATACIIAPVAFHRMLFRHGHRPWLVDAANQAARAGLASLAITTSGVVWLVFDLVTDRTIAGVAGAVCLLFFAVLWVFVPLLRAWREEPEG